MAQISALGTGILSKPWTSVTVIIHGFQPKTGRFDFKNKKVHVGNNDYMYVIVLKPCAGGPEQGAEAADPQHGQQL